MRAPLRFPSPVDSSEPVPRVTPDHWVTVRNAIIGGVMTCLTAAAGILGSHWGGATKADVQDIKQALAAQALDNATAHSGIWGQLAKIQAAQNTVDPSPPPRPARRRAPAKLADPTP